MRHSASMSWDHFDVKLSLQGSTVWLHYDNDTSDDDNNNNDDSNINDDDNDNSYNGDDNTITMVW